MVEVRVTTAIPLGKAAREELTARLRKILAAEPLLFTEVDEDLIGGASMQIDDRVYDASLRAELNRMRRQLSQRISGHSEPQSGQAEMETES